MSDDHPDIVVDFVGECVDTIVHHNVSAVDCMFIYVDEDEYTIKQHRSNVSGGRV